MSSFVGFNTSDGSSKPLQKEEEFTSRTFGTGYAQIIAASVYSDQAGTIYIEQSFDGGEHYDISSSHEIKAAEGVGIEEPVLAPIARIRYKNGATNQETLRLFARTFTTGR